MASEPAEGALLRLFEQLSPGDFSLLELALQRPDDNIDMMTVPNSPNDTLWRELALRGWMTRQETTLPVPDHPPVPQIICRLTPEGRSPVNALFIKFVEQRHAVNMTKLYNSLYPRIVPQIGEAVAGAGGKELDLAFMLGGIVAEALNVFCRPENRMELLKQAQHVAWERLRTK
jgi:hypothetical protein